MDHLKPVAKAVAAFLLPFVAALAVWVTEQTGVDVAVDVGTVEAVVFAVLSAVAVYYVPNRTPEPSDG